MSIKKLRRMVSKSEAPDWTTLVQKWEKKASPEWTMWVHKWEKFTRSTSNDYLKASEDWNPWKEWDAECFSLPKIPRSGKQLAFFWSQLIPMSSFTCAKFDELINLRKVSKDQKAEIEKLRREKMDLHMKCQVLEGQLATKTQQFKEALAVEAKKSRSLEGQFVVLQEDFHRKLNTADKITKKKEEELQEVKEANENLRTQQQNLQTQLDEQREQFREDIRREQDRNSLRAQTSKVQLDDMTFKYDQVSTQLDEQCQQHTEAIRIEQDRNRSLAQSSKVQLDNMRTNYEQVCNKCAELENELQQKIGESRCTDDVPYDPNYAQERRGTIPRPGSGGVGRKTLIISEIYSLAGKLGIITSENAADWLCRCEDYIEAWGCTPTDVSIILLSCMDSATFSSLPAEIKRGQTKWLTVCRHVLERFNPGSNVKDMFESASMKPDDSVLQYLHRVWLLYRTMRSKMLVSKDDHDYKFRIFYGLHSHLTNKDCSFSQCSFSQDYETLQNIVLQAEQHWKPIEERRNRLKAGGGCPSRYKIWKRLEKYEDPELQLNNADYWDLVAQLAKYEDLKTGIPHQFGYLVEDMSD